MEILTKALDLDLRADIEEDGDLDFLVDENDQQESINGNKLQHENVYNKLLPYDITEERDQIFMNIKASLAKCIELDQETVHEWFIELERFVSLYGLAFTKEDHIYYVRLQYDLLVSKDSIDLYYLPDVAQCFCKLMRKRFLISADELQLDWRPLYDTYLRLSYGEKESLGLRFVPENLESNLTQAIRLARPNFPLSATQEMLEEWRPMLNPFSTTIHRTITYLSLFLPTTLPPEHHDKGFKLWFDDIMSLWLSGKITISTYESKLTLLLSRLSSDCMGFIDWEPYIPRIFNHFKVCLNLNNGLRRAPPRRNEGGDVGPCVQWLTYMINENNSCMDHISKLFKAIESFYHPSNSDKRWHGKLQQFLYKLPASYVKRLYRERYKKNIWSRRLIESCKLTENLTDQFVDAFLPIVLTSMFNQSGISSAALAFRDLAVLRPHKVIPPLLSRLYGSYETLVEPHRLQASINCMASVVPAMLRPSANFTEGPSHVVPLLLNSLPGIDSNDMRKTIAVLRFVATLASQIRLRDYSYLVDERPDMTNEQQQLCLSTYQFEDFVIQFLDKCFTLIENTASSTISNLDQESHLRNGEEGIIEAAISSVTLSILAQSSLEIQTAALDKIYSHVTRHLFDTKTRGKAIAFMVLACAKSLPKETLTKFVPHFGRLILTLTENDEIYKESILDEELSFSLLLISEIVRCNSPHILEHKDLIISVMHRALKLSAMDGYILGCGILRHLLRALTNLACCDWKNIDLSIEANKKREEDWPFDNWGHTTNLKELNLVWQFPTPESRAFAQQLLETFLGQAIQDLLDWSNGINNLTKEQVQKSLHIILSSIVGAGSVLPPIESSVIKLCPYEVPCDLLNVTKAGTEPINFKNGKNIRTYVAESMGQVLQHILKVNQDDTKSLSLICEIFGNVNSYFGYNKHEFGVASQRLKTLKVGTQNKLLGPKVHLRYLLVERVTQQHRAMLLNKGTPFFTDLHKNMFHDLFQLSLSHYVEVRQSAQATVYMMNNYFPFCGSILIPWIVNELKQSEIEHTRFKGLLYLLVGRRSNPIATVPDWNHLKELWPTLVTSPFSDKISIVRLLDRICTLVHKVFDTFALRIGYDEKIKEQARRAWSFGDIDLQKYPRPDKQMIVETSKKVEERNKNRVEDYKQLTNRLTELIDDPHLPWHRRVVAYNLFSHLMREDQPFTTRALESCLNNLINDRLSIRNKAVQLVTAQLKLHKRKHLKRKILVAKSSQNNKLDEIGELASKLTLNDGESTGISKSSLINGTSSTMDVCDDAKAVIDNYNVVSNNNKWMQYKLDDGNYTREEWDQLIFIDQPHIGFYEMPNEIEVYEPNVKQPKLNRPKEELNEYELCVYEKFNNAEFVDKLVNYFCFEEKNGVDNKTRYDYKRPALFRALFRNYGLCILEPFKKYIAEYSTSTCEFKQKFVLELLAGLLRGSKHWTYDMMNELKAYVMPILDSMAITQENFPVWTELCDYVFRKRDIKRMPWLTNYFISKAIDERESTSPTVTPYIQTCRFILAYYAILECDWRAVDHIFPIVIEKLKRQDHLLEYSNVRSSLASIYSLMYMYDDPSIRTRLPDTLSGCPKRKDFIDFLLPRLAILEKNIKINSAATTRSTSMNSLQQQQDDLISNNLAKIAELQENLLSPRPTIQSVASISVTSSDDSQERKDAIKLMKFTSCWLIYNVYRMKSPVPADFISLVPTFCEMGRDANDPELAADSMAAVVILGSSELTPEAIDEMLLCVRKIIANNSWHARNAASALIELIVSSNFFNLKANKSWRETVEDIVMNHLICDEKIEVRESSSKTLSGMIHCEFTKITPELLNEFKRRASEPITRRKQPNGTTVIDSKSTVIRHSGIICLCACVDAHPYTVPDYLPDILTLLSDHLTDPQPISVSTQVNTDQLYNQ